MLLEDLKLDPIFDMHNGLLIAYLYCNLQNHVTTSNPNFTPIYYIIYFIYMMDVHSVKMKRRGSKGVFGIF
jgi:hypothetical protein